MEIIRKCIFLLPLLVLFSISLSLASSDDAKAWNPSTIVSPCSPTFNTSWFTSFKTYSTNNGTFDETNDSYVVYKTSTADTYWIAWQNTGQIALNSYGQATYGDMNIQSGFYATISDTTGANINGGQAITNTGFAANATCISYAQNVNYTGYIGSPFPEYTPLPPPDTSSPVQNESVLEIANVNRTHTLDISADWYNKIGDIVNRKSLAGFYIEPQSWRDTYTSLGTAIQSGSFSVVMYNPDSTSERKSARITWDKDGTANATCTMERCYTNPSTQLDGAFVLSLDNSGNLSLNVYPTSPGVSMAELSSKLEYWNTYYISTFITTFNVTYPDGYDGDFLNNSYMPEDRTTSELKVVFDQNYKTATWRIIQPLDLPPDTLCSYDVDMNPAEDGLQGYSVFSYTLEDCYTTIEHTWDEFGYYYIQVHVREPNQPYTKTFSATLHIDGETRAGTFGTDGIIDYDGDETCDFLNFGGCINNAIYAVMKWLGMAKTPKNPTGSPFINNTTDMHGLTAVITAPIAIFTQFSTSGYQCSTLTLPLPYVNRDITLPCLTPLYSQQFGALFVMYQTIISGIVSYYVLVNLLGLAKGFKDPNNDKIELTKL